jgi:bacteriorhodopsin
LTQPEEDDGGLTCGRLGSKQSNMSSMSRSSLGSRRHSVQEAFVVLDTVVERRRSEVKEREELYKHNFCHRLAHMVEWAAAFIFGVCAITMLVFFEVHEDQASFVCMFFVTAIAALTYLTKATVGDFMFKGTKVPVTRYIDWMFTTPFMLYELCHVGHAPSHIIWMILGCDLLMVLCGMVSALIGWERKGLKHVWFAMAIIFYVIWMHSLHRDVGSGSALGQPEKIQHLFQNLELLTICAWTGFPLTVLLGRAHFMVISRPLEDILLTVCDLTSKVGMEGFVLATCMTGCHLAEDDSPGIQ